MSGIETLAIAGGSPVSAVWIPAGQGWFSSWASYEEIFRDIFSRQYYTNHGPLAQELESRLSDLLGVKHAMCVTNGFIGLTVAALAMELRGRVIVPAFGNVGTAQSLQWSGARPLFCDVDPANGMLKAKEVATLLDSYDDVSAILAVNLWGDACDIVALEALAEQRGVSLYVDSAHGFGCVLGGRALAGFGRIEMSSFDAGNIVGCCDGGVMCTDDDVLAAQFRNIRSNYGMGPLVPVAKTGNGRMSEAQAGLALDSLTAFELRRERNARLFQLLEDGLQDVPGISVRRPQGVDRSNHQNFVCRVDEDSFGLSRRQLIRILQAENLCVDVGNDAYCRQGGTFDGDFPAAVRFARSVLLLPSHRDMTEEMVLRMVEKIAVAHRYAPQLRCFVEE